MSTGGGHSSSPVCRFCGSEIGPNTDKCPYCNARTPTGTDESDEVPLITICPSCQTRLPEQINHCFECGTEIDDNAVYIKERPPGGACPECGHSLTDGMNYCPECGTRTDVRTDDDRDQSQRADDVSTAETQDSDLLTERSQPSLYYRLALVAGLFTFTGAATTAVYVVLGTPGIGVSSLVTTLLGWGMAYGIYKDALNVRRLTDWRGSIKVWALGSAVPFVGVFVWGAYILARHRQLPFADGRYLNYTGYRDVGVASAVSATVVLPVLFGPLAIYCGVRMIQLRSSPWGAAVIALGVVGGLAGFLIGIAAL